MKKYRSEPYLTLYQELAGLLVVVVAFAGGMLVGRYYL
jgi:hypothetical protein|tara:strand:+ start:450 stop:563 length:114 start_codon:yes stop_codon:yes gene_type:complete